MGVGEAAAARPAGIPTRSPPRSPATARRDRLDDIQCPAAASVFPLLAFLTLTSVPVYRPTLPCHPPPPLFPSLTGWSRSCARVPPVPPSPVPSPLPARPLPPSRAAFQRQRPRSPPTLSLIAAIPRRRQWNGQVAPEAPRGVGSPHSQRSPTAPAEGARPPGRGKSSATPAARCSPPEG